MKYEAPTVRLIGNAYALLWGPDWRRDVEEQDPRADANNERR